MGFKLGRKANKGDGQGTPALSEASYDDKHRESVDDKQSASEKVAPPPQGSDKKDVVPPVSFKSLFRFATPFEVAINWIGVAAASAAGAALPLMTLLFGRLIQSFVTFGTASQQADPNDPSSEAALTAAANKFKHDAALNASYLVYIGIGSFVCTFLYMYIWVYTGEIGTKRLREKYLQAILRQDVAFFDNVGAGEVATRIQTDTHLVQLGTSEKVPVVVSYIAAFVCGMILAYVRSWRLALALTSMIPCIAITGAVMNKFVAAYKQSSLESIASAGSLAEEVISTIRTAQAFGTQQVLADKYEIPVDSARRASLKGAAWRGGSLAVFFFVIYSGYALAFDFGTTLINHGWGNAGDVVNVFYAILIGSFSLALLAPEMQAITHARGAAAKLYEAIDRVPSIDSASPAGLTPASCTGEITLDNVAFSYPSRPNVPILRGLSLRFPAGRTAALVGASGSGKSTIIALVERFYDPLQGAVRIDGVDARELNVRWLRTQIGLVSQEPTLFATTIQGNVEHGLVGTRWEHAPAEEKFALVRAACVKANADGFVSKLPLGYNTMVGERGFLLSGGQKQRIAIARAIVSDPRILLLDEATSALDTQSEGIVQDALDKAAAGRTTITIAHRLSTVKDADYIYVMGDGQVLEAGTHAQLLADASGAYSRLVEAQRLRESSQAANGSDDDDDTALPEAYAAAAEEEVPLGRVATKQSLASEILAQRRAEGAGEREYSMLYLFRRMGGINRDQWRKYLVGTIGAIMNGAVYPTFGIVFGKAVSAFSELDPHKRRHDGDRNALWLFVIAIIASLAGGVLQNTYFGLTASELTAKIQKLSFRAILRQDIEYFDEDEHSTGSLTSGLSDKPEKIEGLAGVTLGAIVQSVSTLVIGFAIGIAFTWKLGLVGVACAPLIVSSGYIRLRVVVLKDKQNKKAHEESAQLACEAAGAIRTVASLTREDDCCRIYAESLDAPLQNAKRAAVWSNFLWALSQSMIFFVMGLVFWYGSRLVADREFTPFHFFVTMMSTVFGSMQAGNVFQFVPDMSSANEAAADIITLLDSVPTIDAESPAGAVPRDVRGRIRFENVHFRYPTRPAVRVLRDLNLTVEPGTYVALVGASGCGKSTTIQLIERFYDPLHGTVYLDDQPISELNVAEYRKNIALVSQEPTLYSGTVRFNILLGASKPHSEVTQEEIEDACRNANILDFINSLPDRFETQVGGKGSQLSGGQKQRIAIARALLRNPKVLLLDEATSALDSTSERVVQDALDRAAKGRTTIAIAHRLSTIQNADCIYFIKDGAVSEAGTHDELLARRGGYYEYVQLQALSHK
ncbi:hypothetical protein PHLGIDRAFT_127165 [Phlebiopsis gigantea 11061_1 CR5-6]|uniref:P-loop containing nucleoside triphosphate hydrolase protein n=1 Tax=Phlebiopsis gigantea (strain 11061_1 CR5-6) TaxID=745531 RepID=A0A0C3NSN8_PHLG1|nr:hypothetical protein PHLGIDRAFT_127165 [Phlebiopsis gigantea 11061_1 CR5-6]